MHIEPHKVVAVEVMAESGTSTFCGNFDRIPFVAQVTYRGGQRLRTDSSTQRIATSNFVWTSSVGVIGRGAVLALPSDRLSWFDRDIEVTAALRARTEVSGSMRMVPRFDCGSIALRGVRGKHGAVGDNGTRGDDGPAMFVDLAYVDSQRNGRLALARLTTDHEVRYALFDPQSTHGRFVIDARGGNGGHGGEGVPGNDGRAGNDGEDGRDGLGCQDGGAGAAGGEGGKGGPGGPGGSGGDGGDGGTIVLRFDERFPELTLLFDLLVDGGSPGLAGAGGAGGEGGAGGKGGNGGRRGADGRSSARLQCAARDGAKGPDGADGTDGPPGPAGLPGRPGRAGRLRIVSGDARSLFAEELAFGVAIAGIAKN